MDIKRKIEQDYLDYISRHPDEMEAAAEALKERLPGTALFFHGHLASKPLMLQKVYTREDVAVFRDCVETMHRICCKVIRRYLEDPAYRRLFPFERELEELILADPGYPDLLPMARFDIFYNEDSRDFKFCEINTDGTSAMNEDYLWNRLMEENPAHAFIRRRYRLKSWELFDSWVDTFLEIYERYRSGRAKSLSGAAEGSQATDRMPHVAIMDLMDVGTVPEFREFQSRFQARGIPCQLCDLRELVYRQGRLWGRPYSPENHRQEALFPIDAIYRRAVTSDIMAHREAAAPLLQAVREGAVFLCGSLRTQVVHNKAFFRALHMPETREFLTPGEQRFVQAHVPRTAYFRAGEMDLEEVIKNKDNYILKPADGYGAVSVVNGLSQSRQEWAATARRLYDAGVLCQEYCAPYRSPNVDLLYGDGQVKDYINMSGLFVYNGGLDGVYTRQSAESLIVTYGNERSMASYLAEA